MACSFIYFRIFSSMMTEIKIIQKGNVGQTSKISRVKLKVGTPQILN